MSRQACSACWVSLLFSPECIGALGMLCLGLSEVQVMLNSFVTSLLQRVAGTDDADVLEALMSGYFTCSCDSVCIVFKILVRFARCLALRNGSWPWPGHQRRGFCPRGEESDMRHDMT